MSNVVVYVVTSWANLPEQSSPIDATALNHIETGIKNVTDFINTLNADAGLYLCGAAYTSAEKTKLAGIEAQANKYVLPTASTTDLGGVKVDGTTITITNGVISSTTSGVSVLANLTDVNLTDLTNGQILKWDANTEKWINTSEAEVRTQLSQLTDVQITDVEDGQIIVWDATEEKWVNADNSGGGGEVLDYNETLDILGVPANPIYRYSDIVPSMTSNTTPVGYVVSADSESSSYQAWKATTKIKDTTNRWASNALGASTSEAYWQLQFPEAKDISRIEIQFGSNVSTVNYIDFEVTLQASNNGTTFTDILTRSYLAADNNQVQTYDLANPVNLTYFRISMSVNAKSKSANSWYTDIQIVQLYEKHLA